MIPEEKDPNGAIDSQAMTREILPEETALQLCVQDAQNSESWIDQHFMAVRWLQADMDYQSPPIMKVWEGTTVPRANINRFTVATHLNSILPELVDGLFFEEPPFVLRPRPATPPDIVRAISELTAEQLDQTNFRQEVETGFFDLLLFGTAIWKRGWKLYEKTEQVYKRVNTPTDFAVGGRTIRGYPTRGEEFEIREFVKTISEPYFLRMDIRDMLVDPGCREGDIRKAKFVIQKSRMNYYDLCKLRDEAELTGDDSYDLPSEEEIQSWFVDDQPETALGGETFAYDGSSPYLHHAAPKFERTTEDPLAEPLEVLERWDKERVIMVIQRKRVIRNAKNGLGQIPFYSCNWWNIADAFWGIGLGVVLSNEQRLQQGLTNAMADLTSFITNPMIVRSRGANISGQAIRQRLGGILDVDGDPAKALRFMEVPDIPQSILVQGQLSEARSESLSGANELVTQGNLPERGRTSITRTATGASGLMNAAQRQTGKIIERFNRQVYQPFLWDLFQMNKQFLPLRTLDEILTHRIGEEFMIDHESFLNAEIKRFEVLAGSHLVVKQQMAQSVMLMTQIFESPQIMQELAQINGQYVDIAELLHMISDVSGFHNYYSIVKPMTPQMLKDRQQQQQQPLQMQAMKQQSQEQLINQKDINRSATLVLRHELEQNAQSQGVQGEPNGQGMGSNEAG